MKHNVHLDFIADKKNNTLTIRRELAADRRLVWDCYTKGELLDQWFAPAPLIAKTKSMDFREGGHWHYCMVEPNGTAHWGYTAYLKIKPIDYFTAVDAFSDADGKINMDLPSAEWMITFTDKGESTLIVAVATYKLPSDLETVVQMGMEQGFKATLEKLDAFVVALEKANRRAAKGNGLIVRKKKIEHSRGSLARFLPVVWCSFF